MEPKTKRDIEAEIKQRKRERDEREACIFTGAFSICLGAAMFHKSFFLSMLTIFIFGLILYMESRKEKVEKRLEVITKAYYEQLRIQQMNMRENDFEDGLPEEDDCEEQLINTISVTRGGRVA